MGPRSDLGAVNKEIFLVGAFSRPHSIPACRSMLTELLRLRPACRHETYPFTIFLITFYLPGLVCADLQIGYSSFAGFSSRITKVTTISVQVGFVAEIVTL
jgi:hypothetical protein